MWFFYKYIHIYIISSGSFQQYFLKTTSKKRQYVQCIQVEKQGHNQLKNNDLQFHFS